MLHGWLWPVYSLSSAFSVVVKLGYMAALVVELLPPKCQSSNLMLLA